MKMFYSAIICAVTVSILLTGCKNNPSRSDDEKAYAMYYNMTNDWVDKCDKDILNKDSSGYWTCIYTGWVFGLGLGGEVLDRLGLIRNYNKTISGIQRRRLLWESYEKGELDYDTAKLRDAEIDFQMHQEIDF